MIESRFAVWENQIENEFTLKFKNEFIKMKTLDDMIPRVLTEETKDVSPEVSTTETTKVLSSVLTDSKPISPSDSSVHSLAAGVHSSPFASDASAPSVGSAAPFAPVPSTASADPQVAPSATDLPVGMPSVGPGAVGSVEPASAFDRTSPAAIPATSQIGGPVKPEDKIDNTMPTFSPTSRASTPDKQHKRPITPEIGTELREVKRFHADHFQLAQDDNAYSAKGGLSAFINPGTEDVSFAPAAAAAITPASPEVEPTQEWTFPAVSPDSLDMQILNRCQEPEELLTVWISHAGCEMYSVQCSHDTTVGQLAVAESKILGPSMTCTDIKTMTAVGADLPAYSQVYDRQIIVIRNISDGDDRCPLHRCTPEPSLRGMPRSIALWNQLGWIAFDEMTFYLTSVQVASQAKTTEPLHFNDNLDDAVIFGRWVIQAIGIAANAGTDIRVGTACLYRKHWFPLIAHVREDQTSFTTTHDAVPLITKMIQDSFNQAGTNPTVGPVLPAVQPNVFPADCGFQSLAFVLQNVREGPQDFPMPSSEAIEWRILFAQYLRNMHLDIPIVSGLALGGAIDTQKHQELCRLLEQHGVAPSRSHAAATQLISAIGPQGIQALLKSPKPWKDLKTRANQCRPPVQIVLAEELQKQIEKRQTENNPFGSKKNKKQKPQPRVPHPQPDVVIQADQIKLPDGIWQQSDQTLLKQISTHQVQLKQRGIAVMNFDEAQPYLQLQEAISPEGLAIIILDQPGVSLPEKCSRITFPASYVATQEPMIISAHILQLGKMPVTRMMPSNPLSVPEVATEVYRCVVFRDQFPLEWSSIENGPVKTILSLDSMQGIESSQVLDVWDRQYLTKNYQKARPDQAEMYSVTFRFTEAAAKIAKEANARLGVYTEPRAPHGKAPHADYKVIWLPRKGFSEAVIARQTTEVPTDIVRSADRFGLRTLQSNAPKVHNQHRPDVSYLDNATIRQYRLSPLPFGTTKDNLQKVCEEWQWKARPSHSVGIVGDSTGLAWIVHASEPPKYWMWAMTHGDVLITEVDKARSAPQKPSQATIVASNRTLQHISQSCSANTIPADVDPLSRFDPWAKPSISKAASLNVSNAQISQLEASLDKKIQTALQEHVNANGIDAPMEPAQDSRVSQLENQVVTLNDKLNQLTSNVTNFQQKQQVHNQQIQTQIETQGQQVQRVIDNAMDEQMRRIEALLADKRARTEWPPGSHQKMQAISNRKMWAIILAHILIRIGEAKNPGPQPEDHEVAPCRPGFTIGAINPTGLMRKAISVAQLPTRTKSIWGICETHLSTTGVRKFQAELHCTNPNLRFYHGAPTAYRSASATAIAGTHQGTAFITSMPSRKLQPMWTPDEWATARFCMNTFLCDNLWIHGATIYGVAQQPTSQKTKQATDSLLAIATRRIVLNMPGMRFICGDFNQEQDLPQVEIWKSAGWKEVQMMHAERTGTPCQATCKMKSRKDFIWISPELQPYFDCIDVVPHVFPDHSAVCAHFHPLGPGEKVHHWHQPRPLPWDLLKGTLPDLQATIDTTKSPDDQCAEIGSKFEHRFNQQLRQQANRDLFPCEQGRCSIFTTKSFKPHSKPLKPSREGDHQPQYHGLSLQHQRWFTQLRRVASLTRLYARECWDLQQETHALREWRAIHRAAGFQPNFTTWWQSVSHKLDHAPEDLPLELPTRANLTGILATLDREVRSFERTLQASFRDKAQNNRACNPNKVFRDFSKPLAQPVQILDHSVAATVVQVDHEEGSMILDRPVKFGPGPLAGPSGLFQPHICCEDTIWAAPEHLAEPGSIIRQELLIGKLDDLFQTFEQEWKKRWDRHRNLPLDHWDAVLTFFQQAVPPQPELVLPEITYDLWMRTVKSKKTRAATGPDGLSRRDLLSMPRDLTMAMLSLFRQIESGTTKWPTQWTKGFVHLLEKTPEAKTSSQYRPITLFAMPYRVWGSIRTRQILEAIMDHVPPQCYGSIPGRAASHMWIQLQHLIESAYDTDQPLSGGVADIQKCFNHLPRIPTMGILIHLGVPAGVIRAWSQGLTQMTRHFSIRQSKGPGVLSSTGFAEGCPLSIIAMLGINVLVDLWVRIREPTCRFWSYIDNHEITSPTEEATARGFAALETILEVLDLPIDHSKSYVWSTTAAGRKALQTSNVPVVKSCRDLGGQMQYTRQSTNFVITQRIEAFKPRWKDLAISPATYPQKLLAIRGVAWANVLHGIASAHLGSQHFDKLRTCAVTALNEHSPGVSPIVHLSLVEHPTFDPEFNAIKNTVSLCRSSLGRDQVEPILTQLWLDDTRKRPKPGPSSVLLERLRQLGWRWQANGIFLDHDNLPVDLWDSPIQMVQTRMQEGWQLQVCRLTSLRKTFQGMETTNAKFTCENLPKTPKERSLLRTCLNGTFFTANHLKHRDPAADTRCPLCGEPDSLFHRQWECLSLSDARTGISDDQRAAALSMAPCTYHHGWFPMPTAVVDFQVMLYDLENFPNLEKVPAPAGSVIHFFTDGGCRDPADPITRLCSWGVVAYHSHDHWTPHPIGSGLLTGPIQTIVRAEWKAVLEALTSAWMHQKPFTIWCDNQSVYDKLRAMQSTPGRQWSSKVKNHDLLNAVSTLVQQCSRYLRHVSKVCSHQDSRFASTEVDTWCFRGNDHADALASQAFHNHPEVLAKQHDASQALANARKLRNAVHQMFIQVGLAAVTRIYRQADPEPSGFHPRAPAQLEMIPWILDTEVECPAPFRIEPFAHLLTWNKSLHCPTEPVQMWSWWELYIDACIHIPNFAPTYNLKKLTWFNDPLPVVNFLKRSKSFSRYIHKLSHHLGVHIPARIANPHSAHLAFWCKCLPVQTPPLRHQRVEEWLRQHITCAAKTADLSSIP